MAATRPIRVLIVGPSPHIVGGQSNQAAQLLERLRGEPAVEVSFLAIDPRLPGALRRLQAIKYVRTVSTSAVYVATLVRRIPRQDVVHIFSAAHSSFVIAPTPAILIARCLRKATALHYHSGEADLHLRRWRRTARPTMRLVDAIVVPSTYLVDQFARHGLQARLIRNVIDADELGFRERQPVRPVFLSNRQLLPYCNVEGVVRAFALVQERVDTARLIVAADGSERGRLEALARDLGLRDVDFVGWVAPDRIADLYAAADIFLNASDAGDNVPVSIIEAFAAGLPVVSTAAAGIGELVRDGETGLLVEPDDHAGLAAGALRLLAEPRLAAELARNARAACARFTWPVVREQWLALYAELARGAAGVPT